MKNRLLSIVAGVLVLATLSSGTVAAAPPTKAGAIYIIDRGTASFILDWKSWGGGGYDWTDDGCSVPKKVQDHIPGFSGAARIFTNQCKQHDFGYRNFGSARKLDMTEVRRKWVDDIFEREMNSLCRGMGWGAKQVACDHAKKAFYLGVRLWGADAFFK